LLDGLAGALGSACDAAGPVIDSGAGAQMCLQLAAAAVPLGPEASALVATGCVGTLEAAELYCSTLGAGAGPGAPSLAEYLTQYLKGLVAPYAATTVDVYATAVTPAGQGNSQTLTIEPGANFSLAIDVQGHQSIESFVTSPSDPAPLQGYTATAKLLCLPPNSQVRISIVGTDGYTDSDLLSFTDGGDQLVSLFVPGAAADVRDVITVEVLNTGLQRQIAIVF
jgi:hypothetical protein